MREKSFRVYIRRTLESVSASQTPNLHITKTALEAVDSIVRVTAVKMVDHSLLLTTGSEKKTIGIDELQAANRLVFPSDLSQNSNNFSTEAVERFRLSEQQRAESEQPIEQSQTREFRSGLIFSVSAAEKYLRCFGQNEYHVSATAPVYLAGVLQYLTTQIMELAGQQARESKKITITIRHLFLAVASQNELRQYLDHLGVIFLEAGVEAHIEERLLQKKPRKRLAPVQTGEKRGHRWRPGTKTLMDMKRLQKSTDTLMQHAPFNRLVREIGGRFSERLRYSGEFLSALQSFVEDRLMRVMRYANRIALHSNRETVYARDVLLSRELVELNLTQTNSSYESKIPEAALRKMALKAGIKRYGDDSTETYRSLTVDFLISYLHDIVVCANVHKIQTLNTKLLLEALGIRGLYPSITAKKRRTHKKGTSSRASSQAESVAESGDDVSDVEEEEEEESESLATIDE